VVTVVAAFVAPPVTFVEPPVVGICVPAVWIEDEDGTTFTLYAWMCTSACQVTVEVRLVAIFEIFAGVGPESSVTTGTVVSSVMESVAVADSLNTSSRRRQVSVFEPSPAASRTAIDAVSVIQVEWASVSWMFASKARSTSPQILIW
jgi:hypothetical protein